VDRVRRVDPPPAYRSGDGADARGSYSSAFQVDVPVADVRTPEEWARTILEDAPRLLRWLLVAGWRFGLGLQLTHRRSAPDLLGWQVAASTADAVTLAARSWLLSARNIIRCEHEQVTWITVVDFDGRAGQLLWSVAAPVHHATVPFLMARATRSLGGGTPRGHTN
jgi:Protein of unknown function (DUF2867)